MAAYEYPQIIDRMSLEDKVRFCSGVDFWWTKAFPAYNLPAIRMADGPHGLRKIDGGVGYPGSPKTVPATCFPPACSTACSWDRDLVQELGAAIAEEALQEGVSLVLGPGVNLKRNPLCGRNFEYFSEDPYLAGELAKSWIGGLQSRGVGAALKHYAANNQEDQRSLSDSLVDERTLRELYLPAFENTVKTAKPSMLMCAYNKVGGTSCSDHAPLLRGILRDEWGFSGVVVSDWGAVNDRVEAFKAGLDLEMPSSGGFFDQGVIQAVRSGALPEERINESVDRLLSLVFKAHAQHQPGFRYDAEAHHALACRIAAQCAVLLKNEQDLLPIASGSRIALIGALAREARIQGAGSSWVNPRQVTSAMDGLRARGLDFTFHPGYLLSNGENEDLLHDAVEAAAEAEIAVVFAGLPPAHEGEGFDRPDMRLPRVQNEVIERVTEANPHTVVVLAAGAPVEMPWLDRVQAVLHMHLAGQAGGLAVTDLLTGALNPGGKLAESYPRIYEDVPSAGFYKQGGRQAQYREGIYVGYRYYEKAGKALSFPFGHGLSYTSFEYSSLEISRQDFQEGEDLTVTMILRNSGKAAGAEVVQLYIQDLEHQAFRPRQELKGFERVYLQAGEQRRVQFHLDSRSFAFYDPAAHAWVVAGGTSQICIGSSSQDIRLSGKVMVHGRQVDGLPGWGQGWYAHLEGQPTQADLEALLGHPIEVLPEPQKGAYNLDSNLRDMQGNPVIRMLLKFVERTAAREFGGVDYANPNFRSIMEVAATNPLRSMVTASGGMFSLPVARGLVELANGHLLRGLKALFTKGA